MPENLRAILEKYAARECWSDDPEFLSMQLFGNTPDDAYSGGVDDGKAELARELLEQFPA